MGAYIKGGGRSYFQKDIEQRIDYGVCVWSFGGSLRRAVVSTFFSVGASSEVLLQPFLYLIKARF